MFDREHIAAFLWTVLDAVARSEAISPSYDDAVAEQLREAEPPAY